MRAILVVFVATLLAVTGEADAARFQVQPTRVDLTGAHRVGSLTVTNRSGDTVRFQVTAVAWSEDADGTTRLVPTDDLVVYPSLFTLPAGGSRAVRVTTAATPGAREIPYRIFVEELPPLRTAGAPGAGRITMLTRMGIPVFLPPVAEKVAGDIVAALAGGGLDVELRNRGSVHVKVTSVRVIGEAGGAFVFDRSQAGWYLLAGGTRRYRLPLSGDELARITRLRVEATTTRGTWTIAIPLAAGDGRR